VSKESFKLFVRNNPSLITYVKNNGTSWQKLYEIYELYGDDMSIWNNYVKSNKWNTSLNEIVNTIKSIDLDKLQSGIENIQNTISMIQNFGNNNNKNKDEYVPRYQYHHMDD